MSFSVITTADIRDTLVKPIIAQSDIDAAHQQLVYLASTLEVAEADMLTGANAKHPVREYAIEYATELRARLRAGLGQEQLENAVTQDPFGAKATAYRKLVLYWEERLTATIFTGTAAASGDFAIGGDLIRA